MRPVQRDDLSRAAGSISQYDSVPCLPAEIGARRFWRSRLLPSVRDSDASTPTPQRRDCRLRARLSPLRSEIMIGVKRLSLPIFLPPSFYQILGRKMEVEKCGSAMLAVLA